MAELERDYNQRSDSCNTARGDTFRRFYVAVVELYAFDSLNPEF
jgi:hypothetical protein